MLSNDDKTLIFLTPGMTLGDYEIGEHIGEGAFGVVYEAVFSGFDKPVKRAVKTIPMLVAGDEDALENLKREVRIAQELGHPHIVRTFSLEDIEDNIFIVMEYIDGRDLKSLLREQPGRKLTLEKVVELLSGVADALDYAHSLAPPVVHRDLKPGNLLFDKRDGRLKITDFGLAREVADSMSQLSQKAYSSGTPAYMPYEQFMGAVPAPSMDIYSLGIIAYEMLNGEPPFVRGEVMAQHKEKIPPIIEGLPPTAMNAILKALAKEPGDRYARASEFIEELKAPPKKIKPVKPPKPPKPRIEKEKTKKPFLLAGIIGALVLAVIIVIVSMQKPGPAITFKKTFGGSNWDWCESVIQTLDGGFLAAGGTESFGAGCVDFWLIKTDKNGNKIWDKTFGGSNSDGCLSVIQTTDGGFLAAGYTYSYGAGNRDFYLIKTNSRGDSLWAKTFGGSNADDCNSVIQTSDGGFLAGGYTCSYGAGKADFWLIKTNSQGNKIWDRTFGGSGCDGCESVIQTADGGFLAAGYTKSYGAGEADFWLIKMDAEGNVEE